MSLLFVVLFIVGLNYLDPPTEYGIAVNFGTSDFGKGNNIPKTPVKSVPEETVKQEQEVVKEEVVEKETKSEDLVKEDEVEEKIATQDMEEAIAIKKAEEAKKKADEIARKKQLEEERLEREKQAEIARIQAEQDAKKKELDKLMGGINNADGDETEGEGNDNTNGDKGKPTGDPNASGYYGNGGSGNSGDYQLGNRKPLNRPKPNYICDEEGLVIVNIEVDNSGNVTKATPGVKGSTNTAECLLSQAKNAAEKTKWDADDNAPSKQFGTIRYRFKISQ